TEKHYEPEANVRLSNEKGLTRFSKPVLLAQIRSKTRKSARAIGRLHYRTEDGVLEAYLVLRAQLDAKKNMWVQIRMLGRPNGRLGWVPRGALGPLHLVTTFLRIDRGRLRATLFKRGKKIWSS